MVYYYRYIYLFSLSKFTVFKSCNCNMSWVFGTGKVHHIYIYDVLYYDVYDIYIYIYQWCELKSRRGKNNNLTAQKSNSNTVWFNFQTYVYLEDWFIDWHIILYFECINIYIYYYCTDLNIRQYYLKPVLSSVCENSTIRCSIISPALS